MGDHGKRVCLYDYEFKCMKNSGQTHRVEKFVGGGHENDPEIIRKSLYTMCRLSRRCTATR